MGESDELYELKMRVAVLETEVKNVKEYEIKNIKDTLEEVKETTQETTKSINDVKVQLSLIPTVNSRVENVGKSLDSVSDNVIHLTNKFEKVNFMNKILLAAATALIGLLMTGLVKFIFFGSVE